jgi:methylisocitrate lyase
MDLHPGQRLKKILNERAILLPGVYEGLSALLAEQAGFEAIYLTGAGLSTSLLGQPDIGLLTLDEVAGVTERIAAVVKTPVLVDADTGFGGPFNVERTVRTLEKAGAAGLQIEDQAFPKRCGHLAGKKLIPAAEMEEKVRAAVRARRSKNFLIVARTDARAVEGLSGAIRRSRRYKKAGADILFPEALESRQEFERFGREKGLGTLLANMTEFGRSPSLTVSDLSHLGFRLVLTPMTLFRVAAKAMDEALACLKRDGHSRSLLPLMQTRSELYRLNRYDEFNQKENDRILQANRMKRGRK